MKSFTLKELPADVRREAREIAAKQALRAAPGSSRPVAGMDHPAGRGAKGPDAIPSDWRVCGKPRHWAGTGKCVFCEE